MDMNATDASSPTIAIRDDALAAGPADQLPWWRLLIFALPAVPLTFFGLPVAFFLPAYMTGELGLSLTAWAMVVLVSRTFDMIADPVIGILCDRYPSRWGRRRHWLVIAAPIMMLSCVMLFLPQVFVDHMTIAYAMFAMCLMQVGVTIFGLNTQAWGAELSDDYHERSRIMGWRGIVAGMAPFLAFGIPAVIEQVNPGASNGQKLFWLAAFILPTLPLFTWTAILLVGERPDRVRRDRADRMSILKSWVALGKNTIMLRLLLIEVAGALPFSISTAITVFYVTFVLEAPSVAATALLAAFAGGFLSMPLWMKLTQRFQKHRILLFAYVIAAASVLPLAFLGPGDVWLYAACIFVNGVFTSGPMFIMRSIIADVVDTDLLATGEQRTGTFYALTETTQKLIPTIAVTFVFPMLQWVGFDPSSKTNSQESIDALRYMYGLIPPIPMLLTAVLLYTFPLGRKEHEEVRRQIAEKHGAG